jgi:hypothetical protein
MFAPAKGRPDDISLTDEITARRTAEAARVERVW